MSRPPSQPLFLARQTYRWRRTTDAARMLPVLGMVLFLFPLLRGDGPTVPYSMFIFSVWMGLIAGAALLSRRLAGPPEVTDPNTGDEKGSGSGPNTGDNEAPR